MPNDIVPLPMAADWTQPLPSSVAWALRQAEDDDHPDIPWQPPAVLPPAEALEVALAMLAPRPASDRVVASCFAALMIAFEPNTKLSPEATRLRLQVWKDATADLGDALWQEAAAREGWPEVMFLNSVRRWKLAARLAEAGGLDGWRAALAATARAQFLKQPDGRFHRWFDLDWLLDEQKFTRLMEGRYDQRHRSIPAASGVSGLDAALAELGRAGAAAGRAG